MSTGTSSRRDLTRKALCVRVWPFCAVAPGRGTVLLPAPMRPHRLLLTVVALAPLTSAVAQNIRSTGKINEFYAASCANCHGKKLEGGQTPANNKVPSLLDDEWMHGGDDESIAKSIRNGYPEKEMPP